MASKKRHLTEEVKGNREYLSPFVGKVFEARVFVTNIEKFGDKRLLTEVSIPSINAYIGHLWIKEFRLPMTQVSAGKKILKVKITSYKDRFSNETKYGIQLVVPTKKDKNGRKKPIFKREPIRKPKWMKDED